MSSPFRDVSSFVRFKDGKHYYVLLEFLEKELVIQPEKWKMGFESKGLELYKLPTGFKYLKITPQARVFIRMFSPRTIPGRFKMNLSAVTKFKQVGKTFIYKTFIGKQSYFWLFLETGEYKRAEEYDTIARFANTIEGQTKNAEVTKATKLTLFDLEYLHGLCPPDELITDERIRYLKYKLFKNAVAIRSL